MMQVEARPPKRNWVWIVAGATVLVLVMTGAVWYASRPESQLGPAIDTSTWPSPTPPILEVREPTGCLGGDARDVAMVLAAQAEAPQTSIGAIEFATSYVRWLTRSPVPTREEAEALEAADVIDSMNYDLVGSLVDEPNLSGSLVPNGEEFHVSTVPGVWNLESYDDDSAEVSVGVGVVINGELHPEFRVSTMLTLGWVGDGWRVVEVIQPRTTEELFSIGTGYTGGC